MDQDLFQLVKLLHHYLGIKIHVFLENCTLKKKLLTFFSTLIIPLQDLVVLSFYIFFTYFLSILEIKKPNTTKSQKFWHHKRKVCLSRRKNHDCWTGKNPPWWCGDATCNYNMLLVWLLSFVGFCILCFFACIL